MTLVRSFALTFLGACVACSAGAKGNPSSVPARAVGEPEARGPEARGPVTRGAKPHAPSTDAPSETSTSKKKLTVAEARRHMLTLINRDRRSMGLDAVVLDEGAAQVAGQRHAEDMAKYGFLGHWGTDGSVPEQRFTEAGGSDFVMENASCVTDEKMRELDPAPLIDREALERAESMFFNETPPNDGHRKNILKPQHKKVGIGISQAKATATELPGLCLTQEFVDPYGRYAPLPKQVKAGARIWVEGSVMAPAKFGGVGISRVDLPKPIPVSELNRRRSYPIPQPYEVYWPKGFKTVIPVELTADGFRIEVPLDRGAGLYSLAIMGQYPGQKDFGMIGLRTIEVR